MADHPELGWETRRARLRGFASYRAMVEAQHRSEAERHWAKLSPESRETAIDRGFGAHLSSKHLHEITGVHR